VKTLAEELVAFRDAHDWTNAGFADYLSKVIGQPVNVRSLENWLHGRFIPHTIWRDKIKKAICR
jgi:hypothetical protein